MITIKHSGSFKNINKFFNKMTNSEHYRLLEQYGDMGVKALSSGTPIDSGTTARSWDYRIEVVDKGYRLYFTNTNVTQRGTPIVILIQYGHGTSSGVYVRGRDFINPAIRPVMDSLAEELWKEITDA